MNTTQANHIGGTHIRQRSLPLWSFKKIINAVSASVEPQSQVYIEFIRRMFDNLDAYTVARLRFQENDPRWVITALSSTERHITPWIIEQNIQDRRDQIEALDRKIEVNKALTLQNQRRAIVVQLNRSINRMIAMLGIYRRICLYLLEGSGFLRQCFTAQERTALQDWLSTRAENANHFIRALELVESDQHEQYIDTLLDNMQKSGYLYHPHKQFQVMMTIFKILPQLVNQKMGNIFDVIHGSDRGNWMNEPFRGAFVETLQMFIEDTRERVDELSALDNKDDNDSYTKIVQALTIQLMLTDNRDDAVRNRNLALLYRYLTLQPGVNRANLLEKAFAALCMFKQSTLEYKWEETGQVTLLGHKLSTDLPTLPTTFTPLRFSGQKVQLVIKPDGIAVEPLNASQMASPVLPGGILPWHNMQVNLLESVNTPNHKRMRNTTYLRRMWEEIDDALFGQHAEKTTTIGRKMQADIGDNVHVIIDGTDSNNLSVLHCTIVDDEFTGEGWLHVRDIVQWFKDDPDLNYFKDNETGQHLIYPATVTTHNRQGDPQMRMAQHVGDFIYENVHVGDEFVGVVAARNERGQYTILTREGYSIWATADGIAGTISNRSFVHVKINNINSGNSIYGEIIRLADDLETFQHHDPFRNLMQNFGQKQYTDNEGQATPEVYDELPAEMMRELVLVVRRAAQFLPDDYVGSFNFLFMARTLARIINDDEQVDIINRHLDLLDILAGYDQNDRINLEKLQQYAQSVENTPTLKRLYNMLYIVGSLDFPVANEQLYEMTINESSTEALMAKMVLSINLLGQDAVKEQRSAIKARLMTLLRVNDHSQEQAKYYGSESLYVEFKTSIITPPDSGMQRDIERQGRNILRVVCGMLNANGGTLYFGVRDNGVEAGLDEDLKFFRSRDKFDLHVRNLIHDQLGVTANNFVDGKWDDTAKHDVYILSIKSCSHLITLDGHVYVRQGTSTRELTGDDLERYREDRSQLFDQQKSADEKVPIDEPAPEPVPTPPATQQLQNIPTSLIRPNALHEYDPEYIPDIVGYIYFRPENKYFYTRNDIHEEYSSELTLAIHEHEADGFLAMVYLGKNGSRPQLTALRVPLHEITEKNDKSFYNYGAGQRPVFVCPVHKDDAILLILKDGQNNTVFRAQRVTTLEDNTINSRGATLFNADFNQLITCEVIPAALLKRFENGLDLPARQVGYSVRPGTGTVEDAINRLLEQLKP